MSTIVQDAVCAFVREIVAARTGELVELTDRPDLKHRNVKAPDESWQSPTRGYAVEHTLVESFERQIENMATIKRLLTPRTESASAMLLCGTEMADIATNKVEFAEMFLPGCRPFRTSNGTQLHLAAGARDQAGERTAAGFLVLGRAR